MRSPVPGDVDEADQGAGFVVGGDPAEAVALETNAPVVGAGRVAERGGVEALDFFAVERTAPGVGDRVGQMRRLCLRADGERRPSTGSA
jgi:hypothetical protein